MTMVDQYYNGVSDKVYLVIHKCHVAKYSKQMFMSLFSERTHQLEINELGNFILRLIN